GVSDAIHGEPLHAAPMRGPRCTDEKHATDQVSASRVKLEESFGFKECWTRRAMSRTSRVWSLGGGNCCPLAQREIVGGGTLRYGASSSCSRPRISSVFRMI